MFDNSIQSAIFEMESRNHSPLKSLEVDFRPSFRILWKSLNWNMRRPITPLVSYGLRVTCLVSCLGLNETQFIV